MRHAGVSFLVHVSRIRNKADRSSFVQGDSMQKVTDALQGLLNAASVNSLDKVRVRFIRSKSCGPCGSRFLMFWVRHKLKGETLTFNLYVVSSIA